VIHGFPDLVIWSLLMSKPKHYELTPEQWRRIGDLLTRFDRRASYFLGFLQLAAALLWMR
jgi:hypothetical protein